ncbi:MAG: lipid-A-disaccharide synthase N-terminal domain-containing protein [Alphaproteobacteria bacterium]
MFGYEWSEIFSVETLWLTIGFAGQGLFFVRWLVQWFSSERERRSVIPISFWYLSMGGAIVLLAYAVYREDPVFILGNVFNSAVYARNLYLIQRARAEDASRESVEQAKPLTE